MSVWRAGPRGWPEPHRTQRDRDRREARGERREERGERQREKEVEQTGVSGQL